MEEFWEAGLQFLVYLAICELHLSPPALSEMGSRMIWKTKHYALCTMHYALWNTRALAYDLENCRNFAAIPTPSELGDPSVWERDRPSFSPSHTYKESFCAISLFGSTQNIFFQPPSLLPTLLPTKEDPPLPHFFPYFHSLFEERLSKFNSQFPQYSAQKQTTFRLWNRPDWAIGTIRKLILVLQICLLSSAQEHQLKWKQPFFYYNSTLFISNEKFISKEDFSLFFYCLEVTVVYFYFLRNCLSVQ